MEAQINLPKQGGLYPQGLFKSPSVHMLSCVCRRWPPTTGSALVPYDDQDRPGHAGVGEVELLQKRGLARSRARAAVGEVDRDQVECAGSTAAASAAPLSAPPWVG